LKQAERFVVRGYDEHVFVGLTQWVGNSRFWNRVAFKVVFDGLSVIHGCGPCTGSVDARRVRQACEQCGFVIQEIIRAILHRFGVEIAAG